MKKNNFLAPYDMIVKQREIILSGKYARTFLVIAFPNKIYFGFLSYYLQDPSVKVRIVTSPLKYDLTSPLNKEINKKRKDYNNAKDETSRAKLLKELQELQQHVRTIVNSNDKSIDLFMTITITKDKKDELDDACTKLRLGLKQDGFLIQDIALVQEQLFKLTSPLFIDPGLDDDLIWNYGIPVTTTVFATMWGYNFLKMNDKYGFLFGFEKNNSGIVRLDPFIFKNQKKEAKSANRLAGNFVIFGETGSGKTTASNMIIRYLIRSKIKLIWMDPENKNMHMCRRYGGEYVHWGVEGNQMNMFDLKPITNDDDEDHDRYNTKIAISNAIDDIKKILLLYHNENVSKVSEALNEIDTAIIETYKRKNIDYATQYEKLTATDYPILEDLNIILLEQIEHLENSDYRKEMLIRLTSYIKPLLYSNSHFFNGHTTIKSDNQILGFGTKALKDKTLGLRNALNFMMFKYAWSICSGKDRSALISDESQDYILEGESAKELSTYSRRSRKYDNLFVYISQDPSDLASSVMVNGVIMKSYGTAIMNNATYKICMGMKKKGVDALAKLIELNESEKYTLDISHKLMLQGDAFFVAGNEKMLMSVYATEKQLQEMDPLSVI